MLWVTWRQHRAELAGTILVTAAIAAVLFSSGRSMHTAYQVDGVAACVTNSDGQNVCDQIISGFADRYLAWGDLLTWLNLLPALAGVFIGAPLLARELEHGTWQFAFTQTVTRTRWLCVKLAVVGLAVAAFGAALTAVFSWWRAPLDAIEGRIGPSAFNFEGLSLTTAAVFAFAAGTVAGALLRRTVAAMAVSLLVYFVVRTPIELYARPRYRAPLLRILDMNASAEKPQQTTTDWVLGQGWIDATGHKLAGSERAAILRQIRSGSGSVEQYMTGHGLHHYIQYQPTGRFWTLQIIEAAIFLGLAAMFIAAAIWLVRRRTT
jgi:hypothetical protein